MFSNVVESVLRNAGANALTEIFIVAMFGVFVLSLVLNAAGRWKSFSSYTPTLLTSLGILGTFAGVVTGLLDFDSSVEKIDSSIGLLLEGLKTAFISSLVGMTLSILYKVLVSLPFFRPKSSSEISNGVTIESLYSIEKEQSMYLHGIATAIAGKEGKSVLKQLAHISESQERTQRQMEMANADQKQASADQLLLLTKTLQVLSDDGESSLTGQLKLIRTDANDVGKGVLSQLERSAETLGQQMEADANWRTEHKQMLESANKQLDAVRLDAVNHASEANEHRSSMVALLERSPTETLIAALEDVLRDFNKHITEQFGENFKELNVAVGRMVDWQENYRHQIMELQRAFELSAASISKCEQSIGSIEQSSGAIPTHMNTLSEVLEVSRFQLNELDAHLKAFAEVKQRAVESVPVLNGLVEEAVKIVASTTTQMINNCESSNQDLVSAMRLSTGEFAQSTSQANAQLVGAVERSNTELKSMLDGLHQSIEGQFRNSSDNVEKLIDKEFKDMEDVRRAQVQNVMQEMGTALSSITGQFTRDYRSLVGAMKDIVETGARRGV